jgi:hypothetical protein
MHSFIHSFMFTIKQVPYHRSTAPHVVDGTDGLETWGGGRIGENIHSKCFYN